MYIYACTSFTLSEGVMDTKHCTEPQLGGRYLMGVTCIGKHLSGLFKGRKFTRGEREREGGRGRGRQGGRERE